MHISSKYLIPRLKRMCELFILGSDINIENVVKVLKLADTYDAKELRSMAFEFVVQNFGQIMVQPEYLELARTDTLLVVEIQKAAAKVHFSKK